MAKLKYGTKKKLILELKASGKQPAEIYRILKEKGINANRSYIYKIFSRSEQKKSISTLQPTDEKLPISESDKEIKITEEPVKVPEELESATQETPLLQETIQKIDEGTLSGEDLKALFEAANESIETFMGKQYKPSDKSASLLGKLAAKPINRLMATATEKDENVDLVILASVVAIIYLPPIGAYAKDKMEKSKKKKAEDKKLKELKQGETEKAEI